MQFDFDWVDAFSDRAFCGNGCAVVHGGAVLADQVCLKYVRETSLVECTFTGPSDIADLLVKYYLASREIPFAGHPTIATVAALRHRGIIGNGPLTLETKAGVIAVDVNGPRITMTQMAPIFGQQVAPAVLAAVGGITAADIVAMPQIVSTGLPFCITVVRDAEILGRLRLDPEGLRAYAEQVSADGIDVMEPFWVALDGAGQNAGTQARLLMVPPSPPEDPFTGSATGAMAAYLWERGLIQTNRFIARQGQGMGRPGQADVEVLGPRGAITAVKVSGEGAIVMSGRVFMPDT